jgi:hypothetical protein
MKKEATKMKSVVVLQMQKMEMEMEIKTIGAAIHNLLLLCCTFVSTNPRMESPQRRSSLQSSLFMHTCMMSTTASSHGE